MTLSTAETRPAGGEGAGAGLPVLGRAPAGRALHVSPGLRREGRHVRRGHGGPSRSRKRSCTLEAYQMYRSFKSREWVVLGVWVAPGSPETPPKAGRRGPPSGEVASEDPGPPRPPKTADPPPSENLKSPPKVQPRKRASSNKPETDTKRHQDSAPAFPQDSPKVPPKFPLSFPQGKEGTWVELFGGTF